MWRFGGRNGWGLSLTRLVVVRQQSTSGPTRGGEKQTHVVICATGRSTRVFLSVAIFSVLHRHRESSSSFYEPLVVESCDSGVEDVQAYADRLPLPRKPSFPQ